MSKEKVLITGGAGYLGSVITRHFLDEGYKVTCLDNLLYHQKSPMLFADNPDYDFVYGDVRDEERVKPLVAKHDILFPLAAIVGMPACNDKPKDTTTTNYEAILMINNLRSKNQKVIFPTTNSGYGAKTGEIFCTENTPLEPISHYGRTKSNAETVLLESGKDVITYRLATVFGLSPRMRLDLLVNDFVFKAVTDGYIAMYEPHFKRNFIHIKDVARAFQHGVVNFDSMQDKKVFNAGLDSANLSKFELAEKIKTYIPRFEIVPLAEGKDPDQRNYIVSSKRLYDTGFQPIHSLDSGINELIKGFSILIKNNPHKNA